MEWGEYVVSLVFVTVRQKSFEAFPVDRIGVFISFQPPNQEWADEITEPDQDWSGDTVKEKLKPFFNHSGFLKDSLPISSIFVKQ